VTLVDIPIFNVVLLLATLSHINDTNFYIFNNGSKSTEKIVGKAQHMLNL